MADDGSPVKIRPNPPERSMESWRELRNGEKGTLSGTVSQTARRGQRTSIYDHGAGYAPGNRGDGTI